MERSSDAVGPLVVGSLLLLAGIVFLAIAHQSFTPILTSLLAIFNGGRIIMIGVRRKRHPSEPPR
jgi:hypothetical protein